MAKRQDEGKTNVFLRLNPIRGEEEKGEGMKSLQGELILADIPVDEAGFRQLPLNFGKGRRSMAAISLLSVLSLRTSQSDLWINVGTWLSLSSPLSPILLICLPTHHLQM